MKSCKCKDATAVGLLILDCDHARALSVIPVRISRSVTKNADAVIRQQAVNSCTPRYDPESFRIAPPIGVPISNPIEVTAKTIPSRVPSSRTSLVIVAITTAGRETNPPEQRPYRTARTMIPGTLWTPIQAKARMAVAVAAGVRTFRGPVRSEMKLGKIRPKVEPALSMARR